MTAHIELNITMTIYDDETNKTIIQETITIHLTMMYKAFKTMNYKKKYYNTIDNELCKLESHCRYK